MVGELDKKPARLWQDLDVRIPGRPPTLNARRHWRSIARDNATWKLRTEAAANAAREEWEARHGMKWRPLRLCVLRVIFTVPDHRRRDWDNLISTLKPQIDGLVAAGLLIDDSTDVVARVNFEAQYEKGETATLFSLSELDDR